jgi:hypothetical protein
MVAVASAGHGRSDEGPTPPALERFLAVSAAMFIRLMRRWRRCAWRASPVVAFAFDKPHVAALVGRVTLPVVMVVIAVPIVDP